MASSNKTSSHTTSMQMARYSEKANKFQERIEEEEAKAHTASHTMLSLARRCGHVLIAAQKALPHGQWERWASDNIRFGESTRQNYMKIARRWKDLQPALKKNPYLSLNQARSLLTDSKKKKESVEVVMARRSIRYWSSRLTPAAALLFSKRMKKIFDQIEEEALVELPKREQRHHKESTKRVLA